MFISLLKSCILINPLMQNHYFEIIQKIIERRLHNPRSTITDILKSLPLFLLPSMEAPHFQPADIVNLLAL